MNFLACLVSFDRRAERTLPGGQDGAACKSVSVFSHPLLR